MPADMSHDTYESPLATRNASREMLRIFSPQHKFGLWRRLWVELARAEAQLGVSRITEENRHPETEWGPARKREVW